LLESALLGTYPLDAKLSTFSSRYVFYPQAHRMRFYQPQAGDNQLEFGVEAAGLGNFSTTRKLDEIPQNAAPELQDWIALARRAKAQQQ